MRDNYLHAKIALHRKTHFIHAEINIFSTKKRKKTFKTV